jgi:RNA polymerase sigma-70 factor (ECF subfamily)
MSLPPGEVTQLLQKWSKGDGAALQELLPLVIGDLRNIARKQFKSERADHTLQPTALINELFELLTKQRHTSWESSRQFFGFAATLMRRVLVDHAKAKHASKRGSGVPNLPLDEGIAIAGHKHVDVIDLDRALEKLAAFDPDMCRLVELKFFVGLDHEEIAKALGISVSSVKREWALAKSWLFKELSRK